MKTQSSILVVSDPQDPVSSPISALKSAGFEILEATNGSKGLSLARKKRPDLILINLTLSDMSGLEVCKQIKADRDLSSIPLILLSTTKNSTEQLSSAKDIGAD